MGAYTQLKLTPLRLHVSVCPRLEPRKYETIREEILKFRKLCQNIDYKQSLYPLPYDALLIGPGSSEKAKEGAHIAGQVSYLLRSN